MRTGRKVGSQSLTSDGKHTMVDVYSSMLVFAGIAFAHLGFGWAEPIAGLVVACYLILQGVLSGRDAVLALMDSAISPEMAASEFSTSAIQ